MKKSGIIALVLGAVGVYFGYKALEGVDDLQNRVEKLEDLIEDRDEDNVDFDELEEDETDDMIKNKTSEEKLQKTGTEEPVLADKEEAKLNAEHLDVMTDKPSDGSTVTIEVMEE